MENSEPEKNKDKEEETPVSSKRREKATTETDKEVSKAEKGKSKFVFNPFVLKDEPHFPYLDRVKKIN